MTSWLDPVVPPRHIVSGRICERSADRMEKDTHDLTALLREFGLGEKEALDRLIPIVYGELRTIAHARLNQIRPGETIDTTGLVHEAYLRLARLSKIDWQDRGHFFALASIMMRQLLLNYARDRRAQKRGGGVKHRDVDDSRLLIPDDHADRLLELDDLLRRLTVLFPRTANVLSHRYFGGMLNEEIAEAIGVSASTVERELRFGRAWLAKEWTADV